MNVAEARAHAHHWVVEEAARLPGFRGAFTVGSANWRADADEQPATSDVDVKVVLDLAALPDNPGKFIYRGVLLDVSFVALEQLRSADDVLGHYHLAPGLYASGAIVDPSGFLTELQSRVALEYAREQHVIRRCEHARVAVLGWIGRIQEARLWHDQVTCWLFAAGGLAHLILVAGLQNPTIRNRYRAAQQVLARYGYLDVHEELLGLMGCAHLTRERTEQHLQAVTEVFDYADGVCSTPYRFATDISAVGRPISIDASRELIGKGWHREAMFWLLTTFCRCQAILTNDAPREMREKYDDGFAQMLGDVGVGTLIDLVEGGERIRAALPRVAEIAEAIVATNPDIEG